MARPRSGTLEVDIGHPDDLGVRPAGIRGEVVPADEPGADDPDPDRHRGPAISRSPASSRSISAAVL